MTIPEMKIQKKLESALAKKLTGQNYMIFQIEEKLLIKQYKIYRQVKFW